MTSPNASPELPAASTLAASTLAKNLEALRLRFPALACLVAEASPVGLEAAPTPSGAMSARFSSSLSSGAWLHSSRDPRAEARRLASAAGDGGEDVAVLLGFGLGYAAEACLEAGFDHVIACEASAGMLKAAFCLRDLSAALVDGRLGFVAGGESEGLVSALELSGGSRACLVVNKAEEASDPDWYGRAREAAGRWNAKGAINEGTLRRFGRLWVRNLARNLGPAARSPGIERLEGLFGGLSGSPSLPAIVLAAGPSLDEVLPYMDRITRRALVVCVDTALRSLLGSAATGGRALEPDFLVVVDPQYWNWRHVADLKSPNAILVSESAVWPAVLRGGYRAAFLGGSFFPLGRRIEAAAGPKGLLGAGGSVATSAWDLCRSMGSSPIWMAGLDLSYPGGRTHAAASLFEQRALASGSRLSPASRAQAAALLSPECYMAPAADGGSVRTDRRMALYAWWFESRLTRPGSPVTYSLCPGGLAVPGLEVRPLEELLELPDRRAEIDERLAMASAIRPPEGAREASLRGLGSLRGELETIAAIAESAEARAREGSALFASGADCRPCLAALEAADRGLLGIEARDVAGFLMPPLSEFAAKRSDDPGSSLERSASLYRSLADSARYHLAVLSQIE